MALVDESLARPIANWGSLEARERCNYMIIGLIFLFIVMTLSPTRLVFWVSSHVYSITMVSELTRNGGLQIGDSD